MGLLRFALALLLLIPPGDVRAEGHGGGTGDGFPPDRGVVKTQVREMPARRELRGIVSKVSLELPTLGHRLETLIERFESDSEYAVLHVHASFPPAMADSQRTDTQGPTGIPRGARILYFDEFQQATPVQQAEVLLHEFVHILVTGSDEPGTVAATESLLRLAAGDWTEAPLIADRLSRSVRFVSEPQATVPEFRFALRTYERAAGLPACSEIAWKPLEGSRGRLGVPQAPARFAERLVHDPFFALYRERCLSSRMDGRMILQGFTQNPVWHAALLRGLLDRPSDVPKPLTLRLPPDSDWVQFLELSQLPAAITKVRGRISAAQLERWIPGYAAWKTARALWFPAGTDLRQTYGAGDVARFPIQWMNQDYGKAVPLDSRSWRGFWPVSLEAGPNAAGSCKPSPTVWDCSYKIDGWFRTKKKRRQWRITVDWAMQSFIQHSPVGYSAWPTLVLE